jgi:hypothetical protein
MVPFALGQLGYIYALEGKRREALEVVEQLQRASATKHAPPRYFAEIYIVLGDKDLAFTWLDKAYEERSPDICCSKIILRMNLLLPIPASVIWSGGLAFHHRR